MARLLNGQTKRIKNEQKAIQLTIAQVPHLRKMPGVVQRQVRQRLSCRMVTAGSTLRMGDGRRNDVFFVVMGKAVAVKTDLNTTTVTPMNPGDAFTDHGVGIHAVRPTSVIANSDCIVCSIPAQTYRQFLNQGGKIASVSTWGWGAVLAWFLGSPNSGSRVRT